MYLRLKFRSPSQQRPVAVFAAYGWDAAMTDDDILAALLGLNQKYVAQERKTL